MIQMLDDLRATPTKLLLEPSSYLRAQTHQNLSNSTSIQASMDKGLSFLSPKPPDVEVPHPLPHLPFSLS